MVGLLDRLTTLVIRAAIAGVLTAGALLAILSFRPGPTEIADGSPSPSGDPSPNPSDSPAPSTTPNASERPSPTPGASGTPKPTPKPTPAPTATPKPVGGLTDGTFTGPATDYQYGTMTVTITTSGGKIVKAAVQQSGNWSIGYRNSSCTAADFNSRALTVSSGNELYALQFCSGATYSKWGYATSLQGAIDKAKQ